MVRIKKSSSRNPIIQKNLCFNPTNHSSSWSIHQFHWCFLPDFGTHQPCIPNLRREINPKKKRRAFFLSVPVTPPHVNLNQLVANPYCDQLLSQGNDPPLQPFAHHNPVKWSPKIVLGMTNRKLETYQPGFGTKTQIYICVFGKS